MKRLRVAGRGKERMVEMLGQNEVWLCNWLWSSVCGNYVTMPSFEPFSGLRYAPSISLNDVICPPYDIIGPDQRQIYANRSRANAIHVELPSEDASYPNRYEHAASVWRGWIEDKVVIRDPTPCLYVYRMTSPDGQATTGIMGALGLEEPGEGILPHEETISKDKTDRLELLRHCQANISPIWGLSLATGLAPLCGDLLSTAPAGVGVDSDAVVHEIWTISDAGTISKIRDLIESSVVVIADGHHRFETALAYSREAPDPPSGGMGDGSGLVMAYIVELSEEEMTVMPIHRLVKLSSADTVSQVDIIEGFKALYEVVPFDPAGSESAISLAGQCRMVLVLNGKMFELTRKNPRDESVVESSIIRQVLSTLGIPDSDVSYTSEPATAIESVNTGKADLAILMRPVTVSQIASYAHDKKRMPPKSTYFWPKPRTGMVFRSLY